MRYLSVCSGIEAATVAWHPLGWTPAAFSEIDAFPRAVLAHHYPEVPLHGDFTTIKGTEYGPVDLLVGGTPCQSFSVAGLRKGLADPRGNLMLEFGALARRLSAEWVVWENVPGVLSSNGGRDFGSFLGMLAELGYGFAYRVLDAQFFGVPQRRRRVFVVGRLGDWRGPAAVLFERDSLSGNPAPRRKAGKAAPAIPSRSTAGGGLGTDFDCDGGLIPDVANPLTARMHKGINTTCDEGETMVAHSLRAEGFDASEDGAGRGTPLVPVGVNIVFNDTNGTRPDRPNGGAYVNFTDVSVSLTRAQPDTKVLAPAIAFHGSQDPDVSGDVTHPVGRNQGLETCIAFSAKDHGADAMTELSPTLRAGGHANSHANAGVMPAVAVSLRGREGGATAELGDEVQNCLRASSGGGDKAHVLAPAMAFDTRNGLAPHGNMNGDVISPTLRAKEAEPPLVMTMQVRRLTPRECERLQGFPDDYTLVPVRGKPAADGPRYKALGNSMAVPCMRWIGERIGSSTTNSTK